MTRGRRILLTFLVILLLAILLPVGWFVWRAHRALPAYEGDLHLSGLQQPVRILRDPHAIPHLYAQNLDDLFFAQGYVHAQERLWQMDLLRRTAQGRLAEIFGPAALPMDVENRKLGLGAVAERAAAALDEGTRRQLDAYARGVNAFISQHPGSLYTSGLPIEFALLRYRPEPWEPADSMAVALNMFKLLTTVWPREILRAQVSERVGPELAADLYGTFSPQDRPIAEPVEKPRRPRRERVFVARGASPKSWLELRDVLSRHKASDKGDSSPPRHARVRNDIVPDLPGSVLAGGYGASNNWTVSRAHTASGAAMLANDMHLPHGVPSIWFVLHLKSPEVNVIGFSLPGLPWVIVGHNGQIAWGFTNVMADAQDLFIERFDPNDPSLYMTPTGWQTVRRRMEHIVVRRADDVDLEVIETRHGPIVHNLGDLKLALQWTARDAEQISFSFLRVNQAQNWEEFTAAMADYGGPPQNAVYADTEGNIGYHAVGRLPLRREGHGQVPVPGDSNKYDWVSYVPFEAMPHAFNPPAGRMATANNRTVPVGYPYYITDDWAAPARVARIFQLLEASEGLRPEDFLRIQGDVVSLPNRFLAEQLVAAGKTVSANPAPRAQALALLEGWDGTMGGEMATPVVVTETRAKLMEALVRPHLEDDWKSYSWFANAVFLENVLIERPERWLPKQYDSYDALLLGALDAALEELKAPSGILHLQQQRWGERMRVHFAHPLGDRLPVLRHWFSVGGDAQSGGPYTVKQTHPRSGVSERFVVDFGDVDRTLMNITLGESGHVASPYYKDQYRAWLEVRSFEMPFSDTAVERAARHTLHLVPQ